MKKLLFTIFVILLTVPAGFATPDYDHSQDAANIVFVDMSYNKELYDHLYDNFHKKYTNEKGIFSPPLNAYATEVLQEFNKQKKIYDY